MVNNVSLVVLLSVFVCVGGSAFEVLFDSFTVLFSFSGVLDSFASVFSLFTSSSDAVALFEICLFDFLCLYFDR